MNGNDFVRAGRRLVQYVWDPPPQNVDDAPIWCLGQRYESRPIASAESQPATSESPPSQVDSKLSSASDDGTKMDPPDPSAASVGDESFEKIEAHDEGADNGWPSAFLDDVESRLWLTYRQDFPLIQRSAAPEAMSTMSFATRLKLLAAQKDGFTSDTGWGCMIRSGQSLLANALAVLELGRDWRKGQQSEEEVKLLSLFADHPDAPFSIHRFVDHGASACGKHPGEWFGPSATARCIQALTESYKTSSNLRIYVRPDDSDVYEDAFLRTARDPATNTFHPTLILLGTRLGISRVTPAYWTSLTASLTLPQSVGIAGGRPSSSHYFVGVQGSNFFYLDPHYTRPALPPNPTPEDVATCHVRRLRSLHITKMDPSMLLGFLIRSEDEWKSWREAVTRKPDPPVGSDGRGKSSAVVHVHDFEPTYHPQEGTRAGERAEAVDEVQSCDEGLESGGEDDGDTVVC